MKTKDLRNKPKEELQNLLKELQKKLCDLRFCVAAKQLKKVREIRITKKDIARILTILKEKK